MHHLGSTAQGWIGHQDHRREESTPEARKLSEDPDLHSLWQSFLEQKEWTQVQTNHQVSVRVTSLAHLFL